MKNITAGLVLVFLFLVSLQARASEARLELGGFRTVSNRFNIPGTGGSRVWVNNENLRTYGRMQAMFNLSERGALRLLIAPFEADYIYTSSSSLSFNGATFPGATPLQVKYRFNSYRLGYIYRLFSSNSVRLYGGFVGKVRDAKIEVEGGGVSSKYDNLGFVPLLNFGFHWVFAKPLELRFDLDGAAAKQGRAFDGSLEFFYLLTKSGSGLSAGVRILEGGAENEKVNTFALVNYAFFAFTYGF